MPFFVLTLEATACTKTKRALPLRTLPNKRSLPKGAALFLQEGTIVKTLIILCGILVVITAFLAGTLVIARFCDAYEQAKESGAVKTGKN